jgi:hypothetical protein
VVTDAETGRSTVLPNRFVFDPTGPMTKGREEFEAKRQGLQDAQQVLNPGFEFGAR